MNVANPYLKEYKKNQIETATPEEILILLYDGAIQFLNKAKIAIEEKDGAACQKNLFSCEKILIEFMNTLDMERGGDLALNLLALYKYMYDILIKVNLSKDISKIDEVLKHLRGLRETWQKAIVIANEEKGINVLDDNNKNFDDNKGLLSSDEDGDDEEYIDKYEEDDDDEDYEEDEEA